MTSVPLPSDPDQRSGTVGTAPPAVSLPNRTRGESDVLDPVAPSVGDTPTEPWHRRQRAGADRQRSGAPPLAQGRRAHLSKAWGDSLFGMSSQAAFWSALSTAPLLLALLGLTGYVASCSGPAP